MADLMKIEVPRHVIELGEERKDKMDFWGFLRWTLATHPEYNMDAAGIRASVRLERLLEVQGTEITLDVEDHNRLRQAVESPSGGYPVRPGSRCLPWVDAVCNAGVYQPPQEAKE